MLFRLCRAVMNKHSGFPFMVQELYLRTGVGRFPTLVYQGSLQRLEVRGPGEGV